MTELFVEDISVKKDMDDLFRQRIKTPLLPHPSENAILLVYLSGCFQMCMAARRIFSYFCLDEQFSAIGVRFLRL